jgi:hypothetical protein
MKFKKIAVLLVILIAAVSTVFAQTGTTGRGRTIVRQYTLTVNSNVRGSEVFVNAVRQKGATPMQLTLQAGSYSITVRAEGYRDYVANVDLSRDTTISANLQPITYTLTVTSSIRGSSVYIDGQRRGTAPQRLDLPGGRYTVKVEANNYHEFTQVVNLSRDISVNAQLQPMTFRLNVTSNVNGASIFLDNKLIGRAPHRSEVEPGNYTLKVSAPGYGEYSEVINIRDNFNINVNLRKLVAKVQFTVPAAFLTTNTKDPLRLFTLYIDGTRVPGSLGNEIEVEAGRHTVKIEKGGLVFEAQFVFEPGSDYLLELSPNMALKPAPAAGR